MGDYGGLGAGAYTQGRPLVTSRSRVAGSSVGTGLPDLVNFIRNWKFRFHWGQEEKGTTEDEMAGWHH